jgi:outer membrane protein TolC
MKQNFSLKFACALGAILLLAGCSAVSEARKAQDATTLPPGERTVKASEIGLTKDTALSLKAAIDIALKYNPSVAQSRERLVSAKSQLESKQGSYYPQISASASTSRNARDRKSVV